jgi:hypothetical protein
MLAFLLPAITFWGLSVASRDPSATPWIPPRALTFFVTALRWGVETVQKPALTALFTLACLALSAVVARFFDRRTGEVQVFERGLVWRSAWSWSKDPRVIEWDKFEGFRDTPHPWVEVLDKNGRRRTIPTPTEAERERALELLAARLPDLNLPFEERRPRS